MDTKLPTAAGLQAALFAALRVLSVLIGGWTAFIGFVGKRDLSGLIAYIRSDDFLPVAAAILAVVAFGYGQVKTYLRARTDANVKAMAPAIHAMAKGKVPPLA